MPKDPDYGELQEHKAQAYLKVNANSHARRMQAFEASPMWLQDMKPRKNVSVAAPSSMHSSANQRVPSTSSPQEVAKIPKQSPQSGMETHFATHKPSTGKWVSPRSQRLLISWLQSPSTVILEPPQNSLSLFPLFPHPAI